MPWVNLTTTIDRYTNLQQIKKANVLKEYLENKEQEIVDIMVTLFDDEQVLEAYAKDIDDNATHRKARENARIM